jgi:membrane fusion protein (multidrug efflux system)
MNKLIFTLLAATLLIACDANKEGNLEELLAKRNELTAELKALNLQIQEMDTSRFIESSYVSVDSLHLGKFEHYFEVQGIVEAKNSVMIMSEIPAVIKKIHVSEGNKVSKGTLLVSLDNKTISGQIEELKTQLKLATFIFEKQSNLRKENIGSELEYETALSNKNALEDALSTAETQMEKTMIRAPFDGIVDDIFPNEGEIAGPQFKLIRFVSLGDVDIKVDVPESYLNRIKNGDEVEVQFPDLGISHISTITQRGNYIEPLNRTFKITVNLPKDEYLLPNLIGVVRIRDFVIEDALLINQENIMQDAVGNNFVYKIEKIDGQSIARKVFVEKGMTYKNLTYIKSGLTIDDIVVSKGSRGIIDGETVHYEL